MRKAIIILFFIGLVFQSKFAIATTWDEPWQDKVVKDAESFIFARVAENHGDSAILLEGVKTLAGKSLADKVIINDYYDLVLCSRSAGEGPEMRFRSGDSFYFFVSKNSSGSYSIPTPTSGYAYKDDENNVRATYRHSYHQAMIKAEIYEKTMVAIFNGYHNQPYDKEYINTYVLKYLSIKPAGATKEGFDTFCLQHVALECVYHLKLQGYYEKILPFLHTNDFHVEISAARALSANNTSDCKAQLVNFITSRDSSIFGFPRVMAILSLKGFSPKEYKSQLMAYEKTASDKESGFGGDIMDPRVCTSIPTVLQALQGLIKGL